MAHIQLTKETEARVTLYRAFVRMSVNSIIWLRFQAGGDPWLTRRYEMLTPKNIHKMRRK